MMFDAITEKSQHYLQQQIDALKATCDKDPAVAELVKYIIAYSDEGAYCGGSETANLGREIIQQIWAISKLDLSHMGNSFHFSPSWAADLNSFIGNYFYDDAAFDFDVDDFDGTINCKPAGDSGLWLQDPRVILEAARANRAYYDRVDKVGYGRGPKADTSKVAALIGK